MPFLWELFLRFLLIGIVGFGGGTAILPLVVETARDIGFGDEQIAEMLTLTQVSPGALAINAATYCGYTSAGFFGAAVAIVGIILPSFILVTIAFYFLKRFQDSLAINAAFMGIRPVTVAFVAAAMIYIAEVSLFTGDLSVSTIVEKGVAFIAPIPLAIFAVAAVLGGRFKISPILLVLAGGAVGVIGAAFAQ
jgi:chromate transporter